MPSPAIQPGPARNGHKQTVEARIDAAHFLAQTGHIAKAGLGISLGLMASGGE
jgi:hypothetical protein